MKSLRLTVLFGNTKAFVDAIKKWPQLEELELCQCYGIDVTKIIEVVATACPKLKHFKYDKDREYPADNSDALAISRLHELCSLQLFYGNLDNQGLTIILDNCPRLEFLHLHGCYNVDIDSSLQAKCAKIKTKKLYPYAYNDFTKYFEPGRHIRKYCSDRMFHNNSDERDCHFLYTEDHDSEDSDYSWCFSHAEEIGFEEHKRIFYKSIRRHRGRYLRI